MDSPHTRAINDLFPRPGSPPATAVDVSETNASVVRHRKSLGGSEESLPLIDAESVPVPPMATSENDDLDSHDGRSVTHTKPHNDDGFFDPENPDAVSLPENDMIFLSRMGEGGMGGDPRKLNGGFPVSPDLVVPYAGPEAIPDVNIYQHKKTVAQGMMDLALFSANANQLRYVLESNNHPYFWPGVVLITFSLIFQIVVGVGLLLNTRYNVKDKREICIANKINNFTIIGIFLVTVVNVFISAFGVATNASTPASTDTS